MSRFAQRHGTDDWYGVIACARPHCHVEHTWPMKTPYSESGWLARQNRTYEQQEEHERLQREWHVEMESQPLPANWVRLKFMLYPEDTKSGNPGFFEFHSPHCAALYLESLAKVSQEIG